ncbi:MAG: hypothetical protein COT90_03670 [Candidatus Diapherotrites archaeon CG10_big_fil_rev_8_21_14_0_10_31_34]|nr:MAG: hypothetical protein COT90_03670 [Candidatus Diapherotrites archaeon CG10_big_fil_rev_8_21_14_0_10_31_34]PJA18791.1 MAG: hypothetical protein COX63_01975 [Candidatus Diapherotrites archaeon CG_4_10_14_0_2_um_filter_31_5]
MYAKLKKATIGSLKRKSSSKTNNAVKPSIMLGVKDSAKIRLRLRQRVLFESLKKNLFTKPSRFSLLGQYILLGASPERTVLRQKIKMAVQKAVPEKVWGNATQLNLFLGFLQAELNSLKNISNILEVSKMDVLIDVFSERIKELKQK